ncbi:MAG: hypothetical protein JJU05_11860 [Verrucomicrobia bacterium]|nr:hypothetical protein [Verrucomicrobiota bacterium]MCH8528077.1 hypothetical protein [Kiritimatiellia bacterium]
MFIRKYAGIVVVMSFCHLLAAEDTPSFRETVERVQQMSSRPDARRMARELGLDIVNVTWEDTGRFQNSAVGPNISDMTIQVAVPMDDRAGNTLHAMPVIRFPNFSDRSADIDPELFFLLVGNERGHDLRRISLKEFLQNPTLYLNDPGSWRGEGRRSLYAPNRDSRVLVSAQACFLPIPQAGSVTFNPVLFNYQSVREDPAVLTLLATREGGSVTVIDNVRDAFEEGNSWGQRLFFNKNGERASLTGERESDFHARDGETRDGPMPDAAGESGLNMVLLIQVPLRQRNPPRRSAMAWEDGVFYSMVPEMDMLWEDSDVENAVIGHGEVEGPFTEIDRLPIERDPRFPVRVTVQFYKATSNGVVSEADLKEIRAQIERVYAEADFVGSLVTDGDRGRVTEYDGPKVQPEGWWEEFWERHEANTGDTRQEAVRKLRRLLGKDFKRQPVDEAYLHALLASTSLPEGIHPAVKSRSLFRRIFGYSTGR